MVQKEDAAQRRGGRGVGGSHGLSSPGPPTRPPLTLVQDGVGRLVASQRFLGQVLVALGQTLHLGKAGVEGHGRVAGVLSHVQVGGSPQLLFNHEGLLQKLKEGNGEMENEVLSKTAIWPNVAFLSR